MAIGNAIAGDVGVKLMYAMIGQRNSGKGMLTSTLAAAYGDLVDYDKSANSLLSNDNNSDEAKKFMWLTDVFIRGKHLLWTNEVRTMTPRGEMYIDGNLIKELASGATQSQSEKNTSTPTRRTTSSQCF
jgi:hypothetical protein